MRASAAIWSSALFQAYFMQGRAIGEPDELATDRLGGGPRACPPRKRCSHRAEGLAAVTAEDREARNVGINGVPFFIFNGTHRVVRCARPGNAARGNRRGAVAMAANR